MSLSGLIGARELLFEQTHDEKTGKELKAMFNQSSKNSLNIIEQASLINQIDLSGDSFQAQPIPINNIPHSAVDDVTNFARFCMVEIGSTPKSDDIVICL